MSDQTSGHYVGLFIFIGVVIVLIAGLIYLKIRWTNQDRAKKFGNKAAKTGSKDAGSK
ncbi:MAG: hypothetical protein WCF70_04480 [Dehalococcoidales bacterium]|jgi:hypothetical protein